MCGCWVALVMTIWSRRRRARRHAASFQRAHRLACSPQLAHDLPRRLGLDGGEGDVGVGGEEEIVAPVLMQEWRAGLAAREHVVHRGQRIEIDLDPGRDVFRLAGCPRDAHGDGLADVTHLVAREERLRRRFESGQRGVGFDRQDPVEVGGDEHAIAQLLRNPDRADSRMGDRAAQEHHVPHARQIDVSHELAKAADVALVFLSRQPRANSLGAHAFPSAMHLS